MIVSNGCPIDSHIVELSIVGIDSSYRKSRDRVGKVGDSTLLDSSRYY